MIVRPRSVRNITVGLVLGFLATGIAHTQFTPPSPEERIVIAANKTVMNPGDDIKVIATVTNVSNHPINEERRTNGEDASLQLIVWDDSQRILPEKPPDQTPCGGRPGCVIERMNTGNVVGKELAPGASFRNDFNLSEMFDLSKPGKYYIEVVRGDRKAAALRSNTFAITVVP
jgi:hypothetical protein